MLPSHSFSPSLPLPLLLVLLLLYIVPSSRAQPSRRVLVEADIGPVWVRNTTRERYTAPLNTDGAVWRDIPITVFSSARVGTTISLSFTLPRVRRVDIDLGFIEVNHCRRDERVFSLSLNSRLVHPALDIFRLGGCRRSFILTFVSQPVPPSNTLLVTLSSTVSVATLSYVRVRPSRVICTPPSGVLSSSDHFAHAVPGIYPPSSRGVYVDADGNGNFHVPIDGSGSHTHAVLPSGTPANIVSYQWTDPATNLLISSRSQFTRPFPLGTTRLRLTVVDNACSSHTADTSVSVGGKIRPGVYCYYYPAQNRMLIPGALETPPRPTFSARSASPNFNFPDFPFRNTKFHMRCRFFVNFPTSRRIRVSVGVGGTGVVHVYDGLTRILDSTVSNVMEEPMQVSEGLREFEILFRVTATTRQPRLQFRINGVVPSSVSYDQTNVLPILQSISPASGLLRGGSLLTLRGYGLFSPMTVSFLDVSVPTTDPVHSSTQMFVRTPRVSSPRTVMVRAVTISGMRSNALPFVYGDVCDDVRFDARRLVDAEGEPVVVDVPTAVATHGNGKLYIGTRQSIVKVVTYDVDSLVVSDVCQSERIETPGLINGRGTAAPRVVLGIAFNPAHRSVRPYVAVSSLFWRRGETVSRNNSRAWSNGAVELLRMTRPNSDKFSEGLCLERERTVVSGLPVSDADHGINEMVFTQTGELLIAIGGSTNMGLPDVKFGGGWESYLSGAVVVAHINRPNFRGRIPYTTPRNLRTARPRDGYTDVELHATGLRNPFSMTMARDGRVLLVDMGANCEFGNAASRCGEYDESDASERNHSEPEFFGGGAVVDRTGNCNRFSADRPDKLLHVVRGAFYGHANLQRGVADSRRRGECTWIDPVTNRQPPPRRGAPPGNYRRPLTLVQSPMTGLREYGATHFCERLRGDLVMSRLNGRGTWRVAMNDDGSVDGSQEVELNEDGGLRMEENSQGDLIFPRYIAEPNGILVLRPRTSPTRPAAVGIVNVVPWRVGRAGGHRIRVGGWGFTRSARVRVGGAACDVVDLSPVEIVCKVAPFPGGRNLKDVSVTVGADEALIERAVLYMAV